MDDPVDELLAAYYPWLRTRGPGAPDPDPRRAPAAGGAAPARLPAAGDMTRIRRRAFRRSGYSLLPLLFAARGSVAGFVA